MTFQLSEGSVDVIAIGEAMVELSSDGDVRTAQSFNKAYAGDTFNTAVALSRLGSSVSYITGLGDDPLAEGLIELLNREKIDYSHSRRCSGKQTGAYMVCSHANKTPDFLYYRKDSAAAQLSPSDIQLQHILSARVIYSSGITAAISDSAKRAVIKAFKLARDNDIMTVFDPNYRERLWEKPVKAMDAYDEILPYVDVILPSIPNDTEQLLGLSKAEQVIDYYTYKDIKLVVVKAGEEGCYLSYKRQTNRIPAITASVVDATGAGDAFNAGFIHGLCEQKSLEDCAKLGNITAGLKVQNKGTVASLPYKETVYEKAFAAV